MLMTYFEFLVSGMKALRGTSPLRYPRQSA